MFKVLSKKVDEALQVVCDVEKSRLEVGIRKSSYVASNAALRPLPLVPGLLLTGKIISLDVSTGTLGALARVAAGSMPPINVQIRGLRLRVSPGAHDSSHGAGASKPIKSLRALAAAPLSPELDNVKVLGAASLHLSDVLLELELGGRSVQCQLEALDLAPLAAGGLDAALRWALKHGAARLLLGRELVGSCDAESGQLETCAGLRRASARLGARPRLRLAAAQLLALLDLAAELEALARGSGGLRTAAPGSMKSKLEELHVAFSRIDVGVDDGELPLLHTSCSEGTLSAHLHDVLELELRQMEMCSGESLRAALSTALVQIKLPKDGQQVGIVVHHNASEELPWRAAIKVLLEDERFARHRRWLQEALDGVKEAPLAETRKRLGEEQSSQAKRLRSKL